MKPIIENWKEKRKEIMNERAFKVGMYILQNKATLRVTADEFNVSHSTVSRDIHKKLPKIASKLYELVNDVLEDNKKNTDKDNWKITGIKYGKTHLYNKKNNKSFCGRELKNVEEGTESAKLNCNQCLNLLLGESLNGRLVDEKND